MDSRPPQAPTGDRDAEARLRRRLAEIERLGLKVGLKVGNYELVEARPGSVKGTRWIAQHQLLGRRVLIQFPLGSTASEGLLAAAQILGPLTHPNIVAAREVGTWKDLPFLVLDYVDGGSLLDVLDGGLDLTAGLRIMREVAGALAYCHQRGVVHRDIKPTNILLDRSGRALLGGFEIAFSADAGDQPEPAVVRGTPGFMSPEQWGSGSVGPTSDLWNLAVTFHRLFAQESLVPVGERRLAREMTLSFEGHPPTLDVLRERVPPDVWSTFRRCLEFKPERRYPTADALCAALGGAIRRLEEPSAQSLPAPEAGPERTVILWTEHDEPGATGSNRHFTLKQRLGQGAFGEVWAAHDARRAETVALKLLRREWVTDEAAVARFRREARLLAGLDHPAIIPVYDFGRYGSSFFLSMKFVSGGNLRELLDRQGPAPMPVPDARDLTLNLLEALATLHESGVVHRDVKPANIGLDDDLHPILMDFGLAFSSTSVRVTQTGLFVGTLMYAAPEGLKGDAATSSSDIWAAGIVLHELLLGRAPWRNREVLPLVQEIATTDPLAPDTESTLPGGFGGLLRAMLAADPTARPTATEAAAKLRGLGP